MNMHFVECEEFSVKSSSFLYDTLSKIDNCMENNNIYNNVVKYDIFYTYFSLILRFKSANLYFGND